LCDQVRSSAFALREMGIPGEVFAPRSELVKMPQNAKNKLSGKAKGA
jgi:hypothetical protein